MATKIVAHNDSLDINLMAGDSLVLSYTDENGVTDKVLEHQFTEPFIVDTAIIFEIEDDLGLEHGWGGAFGKAKANTTDGFTEFSK